MRTGIRFTAAFVVATLLCIFCAMTVSAEEHPLVPLQPLIDKAQPGDTLTLPAGHYSGPIKITKSITLTSKAKSKAVIVNEGKSPAIQIVSDNVELSGIEIIDTTIKDNPTIYIKGNGAELHQVYIATGSYGVKMTDSRGASITDSVIKWEGNLPNGKIKLSDKGNGVDLYNANNNVFQGNLIVGMHDGIYLENSDNNRVEDNHFEEMRYGVHCMYTKNTVIRNNIGDMNITGAMIMEADNTEVIGNVFTKQSENVNSQGILLFEAHNSRISGNKIEGNRVGLYLEQSTGNVFENNEVSGNFIGLQLLDAKTNRIAGNKFIANVANAQARNSAGNNISGNYWDNFQGIDSNGDGRSDIAYSINPLFQNLVKIRPGFQLLFQSPGMIFLEELFQSERNTWTTDISPLMQPERIQKASINKWSTAVPGFIGAALLLIVMTFYLKMGVKRK
ncbi:right-handed parallel beta-helix repeat-containing protein [Paenibacillus sp. YAF4_2]|uniref:right-handed parallel beta-helix repeat-containing protein n=1 Tax=Paenibacillus sp. YAF4_2 TaxID=3233085 RepID=UPI003F952FB8